MAGLTLAFAPARRTRSRGRGFLRRLAGDPAGRIVCALLILLFAAGFGASWIVPYNTSAEDLVAALHTPSLSAANGHVHPLGTDKLGRDVLSRVLVGLRVSLSVAFAVVPLSTALGVGMGLLSGYAGGRTDLALMRVVDAQMAIPALLLMIAVIAALGPGLAQIVAVLAVAGWPVYARVIRSEVLALRRREFVAAATAVGVPSARIMVRHVAPNVLPTTIVLATLQLPIVIVSEAALSFLGLGIQPPTPSLGQMLAEAQDVIWQAWWLPVIPGAMISIVVLVFNLLGDRVRDILDPRLRGIAYTQPHLGR